MTASKKLFIAASLLAIGYGLATLLGPPKSNYQTGISRLAGLPAKIYRPPSVEAMPTTGALNPVGSVRLLPEIKSASADAPRTAAPTETPASASAAERPADTEQFRSVASEAQANPSMNLLESRLGLQAMLKDESPRPLPDAGRPLRQEERPHVVNQAAAQPAKPTGPEEPHHLWPVGYTTAGTMTGAKAFQPIAADSQTATQQPNSGPPPWLMAAADAEPPRTHVVMDGDSLAKLAGRYLDDPRRSEEIFALNQGVLTDPELLPIGAELKLPPRGHARTTSDSLTHSSPIGSPPLHSAAHQGLPSARPVPMSLEVTPRAHILPPRPVE